jgi:hypothetical protein
MFPGHPLVLSAYTDPKLEVALVHETPPPRNCQTGRGIAALCLYFCGWRLSRMTRSKRRTKLATDENPEVAITWPSGLPRVGPAGPASRSTCQSAPMWGTSRGCLDTGRMISCRSDGLSSLLLPACWSPSVYPVVNKSGRLPDLPSPLVQDYRVFSAKTAIT